MLFILAASDLQGLLAAHTRTGTAPDPHRYLTVAPLIADKRCYGAVTAQ